MHARSRHRSDSRRGHDRGDDRRWSHKVTSDSTHPEAGLFTKDAATIARRMASREVSPKGIASGIRMIQFFINRAGRNLSAGRRRELELAKQILQRRNTPGRSAGSRSRRRSS
jgi:tRNA(adenine34) deaminase